MFEALGDKLEKVFRYLRGQGVISEKNIREAMRQIRLALLEADVNYKVVKEFVNRVQEKAVGQEVLASVTPGQQIVKIVHDELVELLGGKVEPFQLRSGKTNLVMLLGLQGSGKTTFAGKLGVWFRKRGAKPLLVACDIHRPAAIQQLEVVAQQNQLAVWSEHGVKDPVKIARNALRYGEQEGCNLLIFDTAGRLHIDEMRMDEIVRLRKQVQPEWTFLVADAMTGQDAVNSAKVFNEQVGIDAVCLTKMDGDARGGAALSIRSVTGKPIKFIGVGEKAEALEEFFPDRMASRILGMGDVVSLVEKAEEAFEVKKAAEMQRKLKRAQFDLQDFLEQMKGMKKMGSVKELIGLIPGLGRQLKDFEIDEGEMSRVEAIILSMTPQERTLPEMINASRRERIATGSGTTVVDVNQLLKQFDQARRMMKQMIAPTVGSPGGQRKKKKRRKKRKK